MEKRWTIKQPGDEATVRELAESLNISPVLANLLVQRGVTNFNEARAFFRPQLTDLHDPFLMKDMNLAIDRIDEAIRNNERILIYGDYDVDGTTSVALVYSFLKNYHPNLDFYIPNRYEEGYGVSIKGIDYAAETGCSLVISLDCGIKAVEKVEYARSQKIEFIICDHHTPGDKLPQAVACLDPKRLDCPYPDKNLSGCGVGFKLMQAWCRQNQVSEEPLFEFLDLVAVSIASDIVPIVGENRVMAHYGLKKLNASPSTGLSSIIKISGMEGREMNISDIVFKIGPRINAAGRIDSGRDAVDLLVSENESLAEMMSIDINVCNETRKDLDRNITQEALELIASDKSLLSRKTTVLFKPEWHKGVVGIVASRLTEHYYRPTVILTESKGLATGSARSVEGFDLYKAIDACSDLLENFGGHMYAAGLTLKPQNVPAFIEKFERVVSESIHPDLLVPQIEIDAELHLRDIDDKFYRILKQFHPFGPGNMKSIFATYDVFDYGTSKAVGKEKEHLKLELIEEHSAAIKQGVAFGMSQHLPRIKNGEAFHVCYSIEENIFNGITSLQVMVRDVKFP
ncbi:single-stranded-DNA-specific exonuclease [Breznakibacter xylanolyticus]|uniref:Single-stranded-DNA-specific exonuclease RecJ n=1 Tax=Breznakibacter xylanolyticus TaxID=990 RepID=A0A2W7NEY4_9BACT|nr:single-stranded-DNA-specific exonuclease RecJ [Breznakibacter xylanolyticus]PZX16707.1 single-stranded-DNA-specific exonuclease [Breznakibacter xylanolyticus]